MPDILSIVEGGMEIQQIFFPGIYYLIKGDEIVYIGQAHNVLGRLAVHVSQKKKDFDKFYIWEAPTADLDELEILEILKYRPKYNDYLPKNNYYATIG